MHSCDILETGRLSRARMSSFRTAGYSDQEELIMGSYSLGLDYGTNSCRCVSSIERTTRRSVTPAPRTAVSTILIRALSNWARDWARPSEAAVHKIPAATAKPTSWRRHRNPKLRLGGLQDVFIFIGYSPALPCFLAGKRSSSDRPVSLQYSHSREICG